jgi:hypothetical protein
MVALAYVMVIASLKNFVHDHENTLLHHVQRWRNEVQEYDFTVEHIAGVKTFQLTHFRDFLI